MIPRTAPALAAVDSARVVRVRFGKVRLAVLSSFLFHGGLILAGRYRFSYDAYTHMFFADHYRMNWWSLWEARWYTGFLVNSYPPLVHQLIGAASHLIGLDAAFALLLWITVTMLPLGVYSFARIFVGRTSAGYAALGAAFLPSVYLTAHIFGQLPTLAGTVTALFGMAALHGYLRDGGRLDFLLAISLMSTVMAFHHATLLLLPWLVIAVAAHLLITGQVPWQTLAWRLLLSGILSVLAMFLVIWPFWEWGWMQALQSPIDHLSRHNFFKDPFAALVFFLPVYGPLLVILPGGIVYLLCYAHLHSPAADRRAGMRQAQVPQTGVGRKRELLSLGFACLMLFLLGLGDTTPLPRLFFGRGWEWLTYDRFALWSSLTLLPFFGIMVVVLRRRRSRDMRGKVYLSLAVTSLIVGLVTTYLPLQPGTVDMRQVVNFLRQADHSQWRYITLGFGDQLAWLSTLTTATTIDGSYHTARTLPELRSSGIGQIDTAFWLPGGLSKLDPILNKAGEHGVRWAFVNIPQYIPVMQRNGWEKITTLKSGVQVWENPLAVLPPATQPPPIDPFASFSWGTLPLLSLVASLSLGSLRLAPARAERAMQGIYAFLVSLLPLSLCFWYYRTVSGFPHERVYFTYTDALFFLSDALMLLAVILWLSTKVTHPYNVPITIHSLLPLTLISLAFLSTLWSRDWRISLYVACHILLVFLFILSLYDWRHVWNAVLLGCCAALSLQIITGLVEFLQKTTAFLAPLHLKWPGALTPSLPGAALVPLPGGEVFLRAYGTLPHPNILGGFVFILLLGPFALFLRKEKPNGLALALILPGLALLAVSFSRSAWLAFAAFLMVTVWKSKYFERKRLAILIAIMMLSLVITLFPYRGLVRARTINITSPSEEFSLIGRIWLNQQAIGTLRAQPLTGAGIGSFILDLAGRAGEGYLIEPAHNVFLLAGAELGIAGMLLVLALSFLFAYRLIRTQNPNEILTGAILTGLGVISLFDHYFWTLAPGRLMLGLMIGLFLGQGRSHGA